MSEIISNSNHKKIMEFIPFKTLSMDMESILANLTKIYINRNDADMIELIAQSQAELFPIGSFDEGAEKYEYALKLSVSAEFFSHFKTGIENIQKQILKDITIVTAPYLHEFISGVFVAIKIEQDSKWREEVFDYYLEAESKSRNSHEPNIDIILFHAPSEAEGVAHSMKKILTARGFKVSVQALSSIKEKDIHHLLKDFEEKARFGVCIVSKVFMELPFPQESISQIVSFILNPGKRLYQIWDNVSRADVAHFNVSLARSLVYSTERMNIETICDYLVQVSGLH
jgi:hypothetical protein